MTCKYNFARGALMANIGAVATSIRIAKQEDVQNIEEKYAQIFNQEAEALLPVSEALKGFSLTQIRHAHKKFSPKQFLIGGNDALIYNSYLNQFLPSSPINPAESNHQLERAINPSIGEVLAGDNQTRSLDEYVSMDESRVQGVIIVQDGKVVFERYPGMSAEQNHVWLGLSSLAISLVFAQLIDEGKIDVDRSVSVYLPELRSTEWDRVSIRQAINGTSGLDITSTQQALFDPKSNISRFLAAQFGRANGYQENWLDIVKQIKRAPGNTADSEVGVSPITRAVLAYLAEQIEQLPWAQIFEQRVWGELKTKAPMMVTLAPDGTALSHDFILSTIEDAARLGMLFCPSWQTITDTPVLNTKTIREMNNKLSDTTRNSAAHAFKFDKVYSDGACSIQGNFGQGMYIDSKRDYVAVYFSSQAYESLNGPSCMMGYLREVAQQFY
ncbi:serine hydrolase domain-containing protein [Agarivorans litoreus]|uniref:serine hydrolase domain-containing protein n=1 Tax=Agarivorans litoreus TaxID=1510455 RepID=UPI001C7CE260|nr:serine hydrolase domain-containing protein [Agarivorans litoreus]